jgi:hypothetical protein
LPQLGYAGGRVDDRGQPRFLDDRGDVRPQVGAGHEQESALIGLDSAAVAIGEREATLRPSDLRVELLENAPQTVPRQRAGAFLDVTVEQRADANPKRRDQAGPGIVEPACELVSCAFGVGQQRSQHAAILLVIHSLAAPRELTGNLRWGGRADLRQLAPEAWPRGPRRRSEEVRHVAAARQHGQQHFQVEPGRPFPDKQQPGLMIRTRALVSERLHRRLRLPHWRDGEAHGKQIVAGLQREQRHQDSRYAQARINCGRRPAVAYWMPCQVQASRRGG